MAEFKTLPTGTIALIRQSEDGRIQQIGLTQEQSDMLQLFLASISRDKPFINMPKEYDLTLKKQ